MKKPDIIVIDGHALSWRRISAIRRQQLEEWEKARGKQPSLFPLRDDSRPKSERSAAGRYSEPSLLSALID